MIFNAVFEQKFKKCIYYPCCSSSALPTYCHIFHKKCDVSFDVIESSWDSCIWQYNRARFAPMLYHLWLAKPMFIFKAEVDI